MLYLKKDPIIATVLRNIALLSDLLPLILYIFFSSSKKNIGLRVAFFIVIYSAFINFFISPNTRFRDYAYLIGSITTVVEFCLFSLLFFKVIESRIFKRGMLIVSVIMIVYMIYGILTSAHDSFDSVPSGITSLIFLVYCIVYLFERVKDPNSLFLYSTPTFWVVVSLIIYSAGTFFPFIYAQSHMVEANFIAEYDLIHDTLYIVKNMLFAYAMLRKDKPAKSASSLYRKDKKIIPKNSV